jgi:hypothetical protein
MYISARVCAIYDDLPRKLYCHPVTPMVLEDDSIITPNHLIVRRDCFEQEDDDEY